MTLAAAKIALPLAESHEEIERLTRIEHEQMALCDLGARMVAYMAAKALGFRSGTEAAQKEEIRQAYEACK
jgi:hypothetical protein